MKAGEKCMKLGLFSISILGSAALWGQPNPPAVRAIGSASVFVKPDRAKIDIGVVTQAALADAAASQNAAQLQSVLAKLHTALGPNADIRTISYALNPVYQYPKAGGKATIDGYSAVNIVEVTSDDLPNIGKVIDAGTAGGANEIRSLQFTLKDQKPARSEALRKASMEARDNAEAMAGALGLKLGKVLMLEQSGGQPVRPMMLPMNARTAAVNTPIEAEPIEVQVSVTLTVMVE
jgi:uncharacterized protein YggE